MRLEQHSSAELDRNSNEAALRVGQNISSYETGRMVSGVSEGNCDVLNNGVILHITMYIFLLQNYVWWFFTSFINNFE